ncbi:sensor histidine kinase [Nonomuraea africana]|uniref:histidine kinase n=1 Tax=Nonomuraea africana TaxID=46171 RepID=A0ABR9KSP6_9ACTN|nr:nitrate- and nitrite sensing domain-containing protein [Nonomuraea africana]MBE1564765.1 signal transduction histidine kinase [Nonomuraea africana]
MKRRLTRPGRPIALKLLVLLSVPLISLVGLWAFAASLTGGDGLRLLEINNLVTNLADPSEQINIQLQRERLASAEFLSSAAPYRELINQRSRTDTAVAAFRRRASLQENLSPEMAVQLKALNDELDRIPEVRRGVDARSIDPIQMIITYSDIVDASFRMYDQMILVPDMALYRVARSVSMLGEAKELLSRERAMIVHVLATGRVGASERALFTEMSATRRLLYAQALAHLGPGLDAAYRQLSAAPVYRDFVAIEDAIRGQATANGLPATSNTWRTSSDNLARVVERNQYEAVQGLVDRVTPTAVNILVKIGVAGGVGLVAVVAAIVLSLRFRRRLVRELAGLRDAATELAEVRLAVLVERLRKGATDHQVEPLVLDAHTTEVRDIVHAFNTVQSTAVEAAVDQAKLRDGVRHVFVSLARRNQSLLHRQLLHLDGMERRAEDAQTLEDLFKLDHLTTRMRRHAESLIILSDQAPGRGWRKAVPVVDVLRAAVSEVEEYARVEVPQPPKTAVAGAAATDIVHLLAELVENATLFSPPRTRVDVRALTVPEGLLVEVEDRGLGLPPAELDQLNARLAEPPEFDLAESDRLGLFVVSRLAARHGIAVRLRPSPYGGITAAVTLPQALLSDQPALTGGR